MTVLFAFTSPKHNLSFLGSDDREGHTGQRHEKINILLNRLLFGCIGNNTLVTAANMAGYLGQEPTLLRDYSPYLPPDSLEKLCETICRVLPMIASTLERNMKESVTAGMRTAAQQLHLNQQRSSLALIDTRTHRISIAEFGLIFPARNSYTFTLTDLPVERVFRFGINNPQDMGEIPSDAIMSPYDWCSGEIEQARILLERHGHKDVLGEIGCCYLVKSNEITKKSAYSSLEEMVLRYYPRNP